MLTVVIMVMYFPVQWTCTTPPAGCSAHSCAHSCPSCDAGTSFCFTLAPPCAQLSQFCTSGSNTCTYSIFNGGLRNCCPTSIVSTSNSPSGLPPPPPPSPAGLPLPPPPPHPAASSPSPSLSTSGPTSTTPRGAARLSASPATTTCPGLVG